MLVLHEVLTQQVETVLSPPANRLPVPSRLDALMERVTGPNALDPEGFASSSSNLQSFHDVCPDTGQVMMLGMKRRVDPTSASSRLALLPPPMFVESTGVSNMSNMSNQALPVEHLEATSSPFANRASSRYYQFPTGKVVQAQTLPPGAREMKQVLKYRIQRNPAFAGASTPVPPPNGARNLVDPSVWADLPVQTQCVGPLDTVDANSSASGGRDYSESQLQIVDSQTQHTGVNSSGTTPALGVQRMQMYQQELAKAVEPNFELPPTQWAIAQDRLNDSKGLSESLPQLHTHEDAGVIRTTSYEFLRKEMGSAEFGSMKALIEEQRNAQGLSSSSTAPAVSTPAVVEPKRPPSNAMSMQSSVHANVR